MSEHVQPFPGGIRRLHKKFRYAVHARFRGWLALPSRFHGQSFHKRLPIPVVPENRFPVITTVHDTCPAVALAERDGTRLPDTLFSTFAPLPNPKIRPHSCQLQNVRADPFNEPEEKNGDRQLFYR